MLLGKVVKLFWIIFIPCQFYIMVTNSADSDDSNSEFCGFNPEDITNSNENYVPDSDPNSDSNPDSDITVSAVNSDNISNFRDETGDSGIGGEHEDHQAEWTQNLGVWEGQC